VSFSLLPSFLPASQRKDAAVLSRAALRAGTYALCWTFSPGSRSAPA